MRTIKFRAWQDDQMLYAKTSGVYGTKYFLNKLYEDCELMQYTGLKDKNGKEIYEGDILGHQYSNLPAIIIFRNGCFCCNTDLGSNIDLLDRSIEIIGNIHENPELLN